MLLNRILKRFSLYYNLLLYEFSQFNFTTYLQMLKLVIYLQNFLLKFVNISNFPRTLHIPPSNNSLISL
jgi:hypothetical protein